MVPNKCIYFVTVAVHLLLTFIALAKLASHELLRSQVLEWQDGTLLGGGSAPTKTLWSIGIRLFQLVTVQALLLHAAAIVISNRLFSDPYSRHLNGVSHLWSILTVFCLLDNLLAMVLFLRFINTTQTTLQNSLYGGLEMVQFDPMWNEFWDDLQTHSRCCGVQNHTNWSGMVWKTADTEAQFKRLLSDSTVLVPISCCRKGTHQHPHCVGERINLGVTELLRSVDPNISDIINHTGCLDAVMSTVSEAVRAISVLDVFLCSLQFGTLFLMRILFIVNRNFQSHSPLL